jgi:glutamate racemase
MSGEPESTPVIGVRDSGVGGLTVAARLLEKIPHARLLYFADTANVPYGDKTPEQVRHFALSISRFLLDQGAGSLVFACNTTSAYALGTARCLFDEPVIGVIEPGSRGAVAVTHGRVGVLATAATVQSQVYTQVLHSLQPDVEVSEIACPAFVPLVESRRTDTVEAREACKHYMAPLLRGGFDTVVLGCTHYPLLLPQLREVAPKVHFIDPADMVAEDVAVALKDAKPSSATPLGKHRFFVSGPTNGVRDWVRDILRIESPDIVAGPDFGLL